MKLYRFFNPLAHGDDRCVIIESASSFDALHAYVNRYHRLRNMVQVSKDIHRENTIMMEISSHKLKDGVLVFHKIFSIDIS